MTTSFAGRMVLAGTALVGLLIGIGYLVVVMLDAPVWFPVAFAIAVVLVQFAVAPWFIRWLVPAEVIPQGDGGYLTDRPIGALMARRCRDAGVPLVQLGIVDDGTPNAFAFGRTPRSAHVWVSRGLIDRLDEDELDAVVCHELAHVRHWDMAIMTAAAVVPMTLYMLFVVARRINRAEARVVAVGAFVAYLLAELGVLAVSRVRELAADRWSYHRTHNGDALASALVKIAYGVGVAEDESRTRESRMQGIRVLGIMAPRDGKVLLASHASEPDMQAALAGMRWDRTSPWARLLEKLSSHPLVTTRIAALARSPIEGAPVRWAAAADAAADIDAQDRAYIRRRFLVEAAIAVVPWAVLLSAVGVAAASDSLVWLGWGLLLGGALLFVKQRVRYPFGYQRTERVASLLDRIDAGPVAGVPVQLQGKVLGRAMPGYVLSPDLVLQDDSGFVPLVYLNPIPLAREWVGIFHTDDMFGREVEVRGWYFRGPGPWIELRDIRPLRPAEDRPAWDQRARARGAQWWVRHLVAAAVFVAGLVVVLVAAGS